MLNYLKFILKKKSLKKAGLACVQLAKAYGLSVIGTAGTATGLNLVGKLILKKLYKI